MAQVLQPTPSNLDQLASILAQGDIVAIPTETVYGLACNALDPAAVAKVYKAKQRPSKNPLIVHIGGLENLAEIAETSEASEQLIKSFWPGPLTLILPKCPIIPNEVTAGTSTVAVRMPSHPVFRELAKRCPFPLAAPSANPFGYVSPTKAEHVEQNMGDSVEWILDGGDCEGGLESTIISLVDPKAPVLLRHGGISIQELEAVLNTKIISKTIVAEVSDEALLSPGLLRRHYSPHTEIRLFEGCAPKVGENEAIVFLNAGDCSGEDEFSLSKKGDLTEIAHNLYDILQRLDKKGFARIHFQIPATIGIGQAIRDRLCRAAAQD
ncbi:MAG: L-threonylcarbamoyladenylate synthase [Verrucomicrobia bacterium]|nr:L-threonylcarbamoyladenylate synthase [Verrucomicrobiota bacterium]MDA1067767.1 L-threonylcarbamoyladenylate synthase [Verrucomicrobiota bacterium]